MLPKIRGLFTPKPSAIPTAELPIGNPNPIPNDESRDELFEQALGLQQQGDLEKAAEIYGVVIDRTPDRPEVYYKRANALNGLGRLEAALADYDRAIALNPSYAYALCNRGSVLERLGRWDEALASYDRAIALDPKDSLTHYNRGSVLKDLRRFEESLASYDAALALNAEFADACVNRGNLLQELLQHEAAIESFGRAIALNPAIAEAFQGRGVSLNALKRFGQALVDYSKAIELKPDLVGLYLNRANLLCELRRHDAAVADYRRATELDPNGAEAYHSLGAAFLHLKRLDDAIASFQKAISIDPTGRYLIGTCRLAKMQACQWEGLGEDLDLIAHGVREGKTACSPMMFAPLIDSSALQRSAAEIWVRDQILAPREMEADLERIEDISPAHVSRLRSPKIRIGYFSADLRTHPVGYLAAGLFEHHDRSRFEITAFAFGPESVDPLQARIAKAFDRYIDVRRETDLQVAAMARELRIDIAIDLNGFSEHCRTRIFALRAAPIQINFLGYPGTMGASFMDYLIADGTVVPRAQQADYVEKIIYLPGSFMPFDSSYAIADRTFSREELGLPATGLVFCCFNNSHKITPDVFDRWMRILARVENSVLWLSQSNTAMCDNLRKEAARRGIDARRLVFADRMASLPEHLVRVRAADLFLDTFPYNAHATALDALWTGLPLLTYPGRSFASRVAASLLSTAGLPELIAGSPLEYEEKALELAHDRARLGELRRMLAQRATPLFDTARYTRNLEAAYQTIYERYQSGDVPAHVNVHLAS
jgi:predicted O-linked N-acetylglucosamine transferase (SPINDLY family)